MTALGDALRRQDISSSLEHQDKTAKALADLRELRISKAQVPFAIPKEYNHLPRLLGRAKIKMTVATTRNKGFKTQTGEAGPKTADIILEVDGFHACVCSVDRRDCVCSVEGRAGTWEAARDHAHGSHCP